MTQSPKKNPPAKRYEPTPQEWAAVGAYFDRKKKATPCPPMKVCDGDARSEISVDHPNMDVGWMTLTHALGASDYSFSKELVCQLANAGPKGPTATDGLNFMLSVVKAVEPTNELESLLATQMAAVHVAMMHMANRLSCSTILKQQESAERAMNKLARTFATQLEALKRYRTGGEQKVTVEHVHVHEGGQAIVGMVEGGGGSSKKCGSTPCT
jgi:hypothetical protein